MGLFDTLAKQAIGSFLGGGGANPQGELLSGLLKQAGGLPGLMEQFNQAGLKDTFSSWVGTGENQPVQPAQLQQALGIEAITKLAGKAGLDVKTVLPLLAQFLPKVIDKLTPDGTMNNPNPSADQLQKVLTGVMGSIFGGKA